MNRDFLYVWPVVLIVFMHRGSLQLSLKDLQCKEAYDGMYEWNYVCDP